MIIENLSRQLDDLEKKSFLDAYSQWERRPRKIYKAELRLYAPLNMTEQDLIEEMRVIYSSPLKYLPLFFIWRFAELSCTFGAIFRNKKLKERGRRTLKLLQNLREQR